MKNFCENNAKTGAKTTTKTVKTTTKQCENCKRNLIDRRTHAKTGSFVHPKWFFCSRKKTQKTENTNYDVNKKRAFCSQNARKRFPVKTHEKTQKNNKKQNVNKKPCFREQLTPRPKARGTARPPFARVAISQCSLRTIPRLHANFSR